MSRTARVNFQMGYVMELTCAMHGNMSINLFYTQSKIKGYFFEMITNKKL